MPRHRSIAEFNKEDKGWQAQQARQEPIPPPRALQNEKRRASSAQDYAIWFNDMYCPPTGLQKLRSHYWR